MSTSINTEKQEYIEKLGNQINALTRILKMDSGTVLSAEIKENLRKMKAEAERLKRKLEKDEFEIAIVGLHVSISPNYLMRFRRRRRRYGLCQTDPEYIRWFIVYQESVQIHF